MLPQAVYEAREEAMAAVEESAGAIFARNAAQFVEQYLRDHPQGAPGEEITDACKNAGIVPHDDRAFGPVYMRLIRRGLIEKIGVVARLKGHGTSGGNIWKLASS